MKQHPDRQPGSAVAMRRRNDDDGDADEDFECNWIDGRILKIIWMEWPLIHFPVQPTEHANLGGAQRFEPTVDQEIRSH